MRKVKGDRRARACKCVATEPGPYLPPPESELWPEYCRGRNWTWASARFYVGRCQLCAYSCRPSEGRRRLDKLMNLPTFLVCANHPDSPGKLRDVIPTDTCGNFKPQMWLRSRARAPSPPGPTVYEGDRRIRRIPLGHGLFAIVDAADYRWLSQYKWCASKKSGKVYAMRRTKEGRTVYMHREIMNAPKGTMVDHIDHNTLNNRRCNLRVVTPDQNYANAGPHGGASGFVGVYPRGQRWEAGITWRGKHYYLGSFPDPVEAAKARDHKAYEMHGELAYINLPEELERWKRQRGQRSA
jgi:hypothetical protein